MNALSGDTYVFAEVDGKYGVYALKELFELHKQGRTIKVPALLNERGEKTWVEVENVVSFGTQPLKRLVLVASRLFVELSEDTIIPTFSPHLFSGTEEQINLRFKPVNELQIIQSRGIIWFKDQGENDTVLSAVRIPLFLPEGSQFEWEIGFTLGYFIAEGNLVYRKYKNTQRSLANLNWHAKQNGMTLEKYLSYRTDVQRVFLAVGRSDFERGYVNVVKKHFKFGQPHKVSQNGYQLSSTDLDLIYLIKFYIEGNDSYTKHIKNEVFNRSWKFLEGILDGYLAGDGYFDKKRDLFEIGLATNYRLYNDLIFLSKALGYDTHLRKGQIAKSTSSNKLYYHLRLSIFKKWHRPTAIGLAREFIKSIEDIGKDEAYNLVLKPLYSETDKRSVFNHLFFTAYGFLVSDVVKVV